MGCGGIGKRKRLEGSQNLESLTLRGSSPFIPAKLIDNYIVTEKQLMYSGRLD